MNSYFFTFTLLLLFCFLTTSINGEKIKGKRQCSDCVPFLEGIGELNQTTYSGYVNVNEVFDANLFYFFMESKNNPKTDPNLIWFQGGPGCASLFGLFIENGNYLITENGTFNDNPFSWTNTHNVMWVDQPVGTGYSYVSNPLGYAWDETIASQEVLILLRTFFFDLHPQYNVNDLYIFGESYAGKYVPSIATAIMQDPNTPNLKKNLKGIALGDGWVDPYIQTGSYGQYMYDRGFINELELAAADAMYLEFQALFNNGSLEASIEAEALGGVIQEFVAFVGGNVDPYDIRQPGPGDPTDILSDALTVYLNNPKVQQQMNVGTHNWTACATLPYLALFFDEDISVQNLFPALLSDMRKKKE